MAQQWIRAAVVTAFGVAAVGLVAGRARTADDKKDDTAPTVKQIMSMGHKGADALMNKIGAAAKAGKWDVAQKAATGLAENGAKLGKNVSKKGDAKSWEMLAKKYAEDTKAVAEAAEKKDADATKTALGTLGASCKACHDAHKGK